MARGGWLVAYKTTSVDSAEQEAAAKLALKLRLHSSEQFAYDLDLEGETINRVLYVYRKLP